MKPSGQEEKIRTREKTKERIQREGGGQKGGNVGKGES